MVKNCYIHIPFCNKICSYCDFCKEYYQKKKVSKYLEDLKQEIKKTYKGEELETIYIGGGTPTCLDIEELEELLQIVDSFHKKESIEFTIEANIESITSEKLELLKKHKVNRISIGLESMNQDNLLFLNRNHTKEEVEEKIKKLRQMGFSNINLDLIYAIPKETNEVLIEDLKFITSLKVEHISTYSLMIEPHTLLEIQHTIPISEEQDEEMYEIITSFLKEKGYIHYEISNFSKPGYESKHNLCYWKNKEYYGFGLGASSYIDGIRKTNTRSLTNYEKGNVLEQEELDEEDIIEYEIILNLRLLEGIDLKEFEKKYHHSLKEDYNYQDLVEQGLLIDENNHVKIPEKLLYVSNEIIVKFLQTKKV